MIKITCTKCNKPLSLDETKLPMKEVSFPCPVCKTKLSVDRRNLGADAPAAAAISPQPVVAAAGADDEDNNEDEFGAKALIVGNDNPSLRQAMKLIGLMPVHYANAEQARDRYMQEVPQVVVLNPPQVTAPPIESMQSMINLPAAERRKSFFILVSDNLRSLDGNAAFLYGVNLTLATKDLASFPQIYKEASQHHERMYSAMNAALRSLEGEV